MAALIFCVLGLLIVGGSCTPAKNFPQKTADKTFMERQMQMMHLFYHIYEPIYNPELKTIAESWSIVNNAALYTNTTAVKHYTMIEHALLPKDVPFNALAGAHAYEAMTLFNVLYSAKDYETFYKTAVYVRERTNPQLFVYVLSIAIIHRMDTQGMIIPPLYELMPNFYFNGEVMTTAQRVHTHGSEFYDNFMGHSIMYKKDNDVVIRWNDTTWPYHFVDSSLSYFTHDYALNTYYYNQHLAYPYWMGSDSVPLVKDRHGERIWFAHKQLMARYYMERLSNGLGEVPDLGFHQVKDGYFNGLVYWNGVPFPSRPNHFKFDYPEYTQALMEIEDLERRVRDAIDFGFVVNDKGEKVDITKPDAIDILGRVIKSSRDSPNVNFYKDFINLWKRVLANPSTYSSHDYYYHLPLHAPGVLEHYQTALRDPAFYMIWKRVLNMFNKWHRTLPTYTVKELAVPSVEIQEVTVDKFMTYFEQTYVNVVNALYTTEHERKNLDDDVNVLVEVPRLNHKVFTVRVNVKSNAAKKVVVRFFLAPKYDSKGYEPWMYHNTENFFQLDQFIYDLPAGETVIERASTDNTYLVDNWTSGFKLYEELENLVKTNGQFKLDKSENMFSFPRHLLLPKGRVGGMPFQFLVTITEYHAPAVAYGTGFDPATSYGFGTGALRMTSQPLGYPMDRPMPHWVMGALPNFHLSEVMIFHKKSVEVSIPHVE